MTYQVEVNTEALSKRLQDIGTTLTGGQDG